ncbi:TonB-dependent receptor [Opitutaceae bacterium]
MLSFVFSRGALRRLLQLGGVSAPLSLVYAQPLVSNSEPQQLERVVVEGRSADLIGTASAASEGSVGYVELADRPFLRRGELLEVIPGVVITQHSGGGKANQYFLRGFNLDHGTDFSVSVDGMPVNMRTHAHGQGYADLNFLVPEFVESVGYSKGPFFAAVGDFSGAGAANFRLFSELPNDFVTLEAGEHGYLRTVAGVTTHRGANATTFGVEAEHYDGPWLLEDDFRRFNGLIRHTWTAGMGSFSLTALGYHAEWNATDQIPLRAVESGVLDRFGFVDPSNGGVTDRVSVSFDGTIKAADGETRFNAYAIHYRLNLFSNFTYFLDDPVNGDQFNQRDRRLIAGGELARTWSGEGRASTTLGVQMRADVINGLALNRTAQRAVQSVVRSDDVTQASAGLFTSTTLQFSERLRGEFGLRGDLYFFDVESDNPLNSGEATAGIFSPKASLVYSAGEKTELYFNVGHGFHSNDARGTVIRVDPISGGPADRVDPLSRSLGFEAGLRTSFVPGLVTTVSLWQLDLDSELVFVGDAGGTEASEASRRYGIEVANFYRVGSWLTLDADIAFTHARYRDAGPDDRIANSLDTVITAGATVDWASGWFAGLRLRYFGDQPLIEDDSVRAPSSLTLNGRLGYATRDWEAAVDVLNLLDRENNDIAYFYGSRLPGEAADGVEDVHFHPAEPLTVRFSLTRRF